MILIRMSMADADEALEDRESGLIAETEAPLNE